MHHQSYGRNHNQGRTQFAPAQVTGEQKSAPHALTWGALLIRLDLVYKICDGLTCHFIDYFVLQRPEEIVQFTRGDFTLCTVLIRVETAVDLEFTLDGEEYVV